MAHQLIALNAHAEDLGLIFSTQMLVDSYL